MQRACNTSAAELESARNAGRLMALQERRAVAGYRCPYRKADKIRAWHEGLNEVRSRIDRADAGEIAAVPEAEREANKAALADKINAWLAKQSTEEEAND